MISKMMVCALLSQCLLFTAAAQTQPQDAFLLEQSWNHGLTLTLSSSQTVADHYGIAVDTSNRAWIVNGTGVYVYNSSGLLLTNWALSNAKGVKYDAISNQVWVSRLQSSPPQIYTYNSAYNLVSQWGTNSLTPSNLALGKENVYIADAAHQQIQVFSRGGIFQRVMTTPGMQYVPDVAVGSDDTIFTGSYNIYQTNYNFTCRFDTNANLLATYSSSYNHPAVIAMAPDGILSCWPGNFGSGYAPATFDYGLSYLGLPPIGGAPAGACFSPTGDRLYYLSTSAVLVYRRCYRTAGTKPVNALPLPYIWNTSQRSATAWIDADFIVNDADNTNVICAAYAMINGQNNLLAFVPMKTLITNGADVVSLANINTGVKHHLVWDAGTDWPTRYGYIKLAMMARDHRNLLDTHFITIPTNANPSFAFSNIVTISQSPFQNNDFLNVWYWLLCTDSSVTLSNGTVYSIVNNYGVTNGAQLALTTISGATNSTTTADGRTFIFSMMSSNLVSTIYSNRVIRIATTNEINQAKVGTTGNLTNAVKWTPRVQINGLPQNVNELSFDTGLIGSSGSIPTNAWWIVLTPASP